MTSPSAPILSTISPSSSGRNRLLHWLNQWQPTPDRWIPLFALLIGGSTGLCIAIFRFLIQACQQIAFGDVLGALSSWGAWTLMLIPALGGLMIGILRLWFPRFLGQGLSSLMNPNLQSVSLWRPIVKMLAAAIALGTGASLGPEGPSAEIGASLGGIFSQPFRVSKERYRLFLGAGAAAGIAAGFNAPIAGVFFALEVVLGTSFTTSAASLILLSSVVSSLVSGTLLGVHPAFTLPAYQVLSPWEWIYYFGLGVLASGVSLLFTQIVRGCQASFRGEVAALQWLSTIPPVFQPVLGGLVVGAIALLLPQVLDVGYGSFNVILSGDSWPLATLALLLGAKLLATAISSGSGLVGGIFAPAMFLGACLGSFYGQGLAIALPPGFDHIAPPPAYAMVGMAAVLAGTVRAPLTAILLLFELTKNYLIILPLMVAVGVSVQGAEWIKARQSVQSLDLAQMGVSLVKETAQDLLASVQIQDVMNTTYLMLPLSTPIVDAGATMVGESVRAAILVDPSDRPVGIVTLTDIKRGLSGTGRSPLGSTLSDIATKEILIAYPDESAAQAITRMDSRGLHFLPVVDRDHPAKVLGIVERDRILLAGELKSMQSLLTHQELQTV